jgi:hypothetical protein
LTAKDLQAAKDLQDLASGKGFDGLGLHVLTQMNVCLNSTPDDDSDNSSKALMKRVRDGTMSAKEAIARLGKDQKDEKDQDLASMSAKEASKYVQQVNCMKGQRFTFPSFLTFHHPLFLAACLWAECHGPT